MRIGEICKRDMAIIDKDASIREAVRCMRDNHVGGVVVTEGVEPNRVPIGILTHRDIIIEILAEDVDANNLCVADIMSYDLLTAREEDDILDTIKAMQTKGVRRVPVINQTRRLVGIVAVDDLIDLMADQLANMAMLLKHTPNTDRTALPETRHDPRPRG